MSPDTAPMLLVKDLRRVYRSKGSFFGEGREVVALNRLDLAVGKAEIFGLVGESGSGKTTCGRLVVGLENPDGGDILLDGQSILGLKGAARRRYRRRVQMVFQDPYQSLNPQLTILDSVGEPLVTNRVGDSASRVARVLATLKETGLSPAEDFAFRFPHQLSGGQRQRVAIARAMVIEPDVLVADEPTSMLDASYAAQIFEVLKDLRDQHGTTILFITHGMAAARYLTDRIAVIYRGHLMEVGPTQAVIERPAHPYTQALIDATPKFGPCEGIPTFDTLLVPPRAERGEGGCPFFPRCRRGKDDPCARTALPRVVVEEGHWAACHFATGAGRSLAEAGDQCRLGG